MSDVLDAVIVGEAARRAAAPSCSRHASASAVERALRDQGEESIGYSLRAATEVLERDS